MHYGVHTICMSVHIWTLSHIKHMYVSVRIWTPSHTWLTHSVPIQHILRKIYIYIYIYTNWLIGLVGKVFANGPGDLDSIPSRVIPKTLKMALDTSLLNTQQYKARIKGKVEQPRERSSALPNMCCINNWLIKLSPSCLYVFPAKQHDYVFFEFLKRMMYNSWSVADVYVS